MRRFPAVLLLAIFGFPVIGPALAAHTIAGVPACCRREGKHHCANADSSGGGLKAVGARCSAFPGAGVFPLHHDTALAAGVQLVFGAILRHPAVAAQAAAGYRISFSRSRQKRGPPSLFS